MIAPISNRNLMKRILLLVITMALLSSCITDGVRKKMDEQMVLADKIFGDMHFKNAISQIEMHKLRNGSYPGSLSDLQFLAAMDSGMFQFVEYQKLDSGYELNFKENVFSSIIGEKRKPVNLEYPAEFWKGLGCVRSNAKKE
jgi:hypothetical protein